MSNNIFKANYIQVSSDQVRVIDNSTLMARKYEEYNVGRMAEEPDVEEEEIGQNPDEGFEPFDLAGLVTDFDAADTNVISQLPEDVEKRRAEILENAQNEARAQADLIIQNAMQEAENIKEEAYKTAVKDGYNDGVARAESEKQMALETYENRRKELEAEYNSLFETFEPNLVQTITDIYRKVFGEGLYDYSQVIIYIINKALQGAQSDGNVVLHVSQDDYDFVVENKEALLEKVSIDGKLDIKASADLTAGSAKIETNYGLLDCGIDTQLKELTGKLTALSVEVE